MFDGGSTIDKKREEGSDSKEGEAAVRRSENKRVVRRRYGRRLRSTKANRKFNFFFFCQLTRSS